MPDQPVAVNLRGSQLRIEVSPGSPLLDAPHRIFFLAVLGFDVAQDFCGFVNDGTSDRAEIVQQVTKYLSDEGFLPALDEEAEAATRQIQVELEQLVWYGSARNRVGAALMVVRGAHDDVPGVCERFDAANSPG